MSRFYVSASGSAKTVATRRGTTNKPTKAHVRGWDCGVSVEAFADGEKDCFNVYVTGGSSGEGSSKLIGVVSDGQFYPKPNEMNEQSE